MAVTITPYNHTALQLLDNALSTEAPNFYLALSDGTTAFDAAHTSLSETLGGGVDEVYSNGWPQGGVQLAGFSVATTGTTNATIDADDITVAATGGAISATHAVIYLDVGGAGTTMVPLWHISFGEQITAPDGVDFQVVWDAAGIATVSLAT